MPGVGVQEALTYDHKSVDVVEDTGNDAGSFLLTDRFMFNDSISTLIKAGRLPRDVEKHAISRSLRFGHFYNLWGRGIQDYTVIPYLKGQAK